VSKVLKAAAQWAVVALLCLAAAELALRLQQWAGPLYDLEERSANFDWYSDVVNHRPVRHSVHTFTGKSMYGALDGVTYTEDFDELGIRQPVSSAGAGNCPNRISILFMGDSFIEGYDVPHTVPDKVAHRLADEYGICTTIYNSGLSSYSPAIFVPLARQLMPVLKPDYIVVDVDETDFEDDVYRYEPLLVRDSHGRNVGVRASPLYVEVTRRVIEMRSRPFYLQRLVEKLRLRHLVQQAPARDFTFSRDHGDDLEVRYARELSIFRRNLSELIHVLGAGLSSNGHIVFIRHPHLEHLTPQGKGFVWNGAVGATVGQVAKAHGAQFFDAVPVLRQRFGGQPQKYYWPGDMHYNFEGSDLYADSVADFLAQTLR
jgi:lysophospholipase L1-like esterase